MHLPTKLLYCYVSLSLYSAVSSAVKRALQKSHEKPQAEKWMDVFLPRKSELNQVESLVDLINTVALKYLNNCPSVILYDFTIENEDDLLLQKLFREFPSSIFHGHISNDYSIDKKMFNHFKKACVNYILIIEDVMRCQDIIGIQNENKVLIVAKSSQWRVHEFLASDASHGFINLLVISESEALSASRTEMPFILYTHNLYVDGIGSSTPQVITSWMNNGLTRPQANLFPEKLKKGFAGHRFIFSLANQPPFVIKKTRDNNDEIQWEGIEVRLAKLLAEIYNFTTDFREAPNIDIMGSGEAVVAELKNMKADVGMAGIYLVPDRFKVVDISYGHSHDCAAFISLTTIALSIWRAILGPFQWTVWLCITLIYLFAIFPLVFSDRYSLMYLVETPEEIENMFWYVFGTFTNCFTFIGKQTWGKSEKITTRILVGSYWAFTIIITACYTGSIIAFVTLPVFPDTVDNVQQLLDKRYQIGMLDKDGWKTWYQNSSDPKTLKLLENIEYVSSVEAGIRNITTAFFWSYAYLGSSAELEYVVRKNFSLGYKKSMLHISSNCFAPYRVGMVFQPNSIYKAILNEGTMRALESGFVIKLKNDVEWEMMRSSTGRLLQVSTNSHKMLSAEDRAVTLQDTQGMFLLLGIGFSVGGSFLLSEIFGGCFNLFKLKRSKSTTSITSNPRSHDVPTPRQKLDSIQYSRNSFPFDAFEESDIAEQNTKETSARNENDEKILNDVENEEIDKQVDEIFDLEKYFGEDNNESDNDNKYNTDEIK